MGFFAWSLRDSADLVTRRWGSDLLVWHRRAGDIHLLSGHAAALFERLHRGSASTDEIRQAITLACAEGSVDNAAVEATLQDMMRLGLVTAHPT